MTFMTAFQFSFIMRSPLIIDDGLPSHTYLELLDDMKYSDILLLNRTVNRKEEWIFLKEETDEKQRVVTPDVKISK